MRIYVIKLSDIDWEDIARWVQTKAMFAQVATVDAHHFPVIRTMGALLNEDWTVDLIQRSVHHRIAQLRATPTVTLSWVGASVPGSRNDRPTVFDYGWPIPRAVILKGIAHFCGADWTVRRYRELTAILAERGPNNATRRTDENVRMELTGLHITPVAVRAEGFGDAAEAFTRTW